MGALFRGLKIRHIHDAGTNAKAIATGTVHSLKPLFFKIILGIKNLAPTARPAAGAISKNVDSAGT
jgi:hypothetical protein